jgi:sulfur relay (sulfurtransferase) DsrC/TusE family protein|tara:strand:- start:1448 stop:1681 length:234 start_codon:yes stop_codon:yes gene_type:complete
MNGTKTMIKIEKDVHLSARSKYDEYIQAMINMKKGESFVVNEYKIVDAVRHYAWQKGIKVSFRTIAKEKFRIWKLES